MDGWLAGWVGGWVDGWMGEYTLAQKRAGRQAQQAQAHAFVSVT